MADSISKWANQIHLGDCLAVMSEMPSNSVDLVITSPPYGNLRKHDYGGVDVADYVEWFVPRAVQILRVLKPSGSFVLNIKEGVTDGERQTYVLDLILKLKREVGFCWIEEYIWCKTNPIPGRFKLRMKNGWERLLHFSKTTDLKIRKDAVKVPSVRSDAERAAEPRREGVEISKSGSQRRIRRHPDWGGNAFVFPSNVLHLGVAKHNVVHSAVYPKRIPEFFIKLFTDPEDLVLDPFVGSGTTSVVAAELGRCHIGIEVQQRFVDIARQRLADVALANQSDM